MNEGSGDYMNDENVKTTDPINDDFVVQIANTNNIKTGLVNSSYDDKNDILEGTKVENVEIDTSFIEELDSAEEDSEKDIFYDTKNGNFGIQIHTPRLS